MKKTNLLAEKQVIKLKTGQKIEIGISEKKTSDGQQYKKMLRILNDEGNANPNHGEVPPHIH
jgi:hypothetical protein